MSAVEFEAVRPVLKMRHDLVAAARAVLVDGLSFRAAQAELGLSSPNSVLQAVNQVWAAAEQLPPEQRAVASSTVVPPGWEQVTLVAPTDLIAWFRVQLAQRVASLSPPSPSAERKATGKEKGSS
jgi:hypothetical protein